MFLRKSVQLFSCFIFMFCSVSSVSATLVPYSYQAGIRLGEQFAYDLRDVPVEVYLGQNPNGGSAIAYSQDISAQMCGGTRSDHAWANTSWNTSGLSSINLSFDYSISGDAWISARSKLFSFYDYTLAGDKTGRFQSTISLNPNEDSITLSSSAHGGTGINKASITNIQLSQTSAVPLPATVWLLGSGLVGLIGLKKKFLG